MAAGNLGTVKLDHWLFLILLIAVVLSFPYWFWLLKLPAPSLTENRNLARFPAWPDSLSQAAVLPAQLDAYIVDRYPPRTVFIEALNYTRYEFRYSALADVAVGRRGWLYYNAQNINYFHHRGLWRLAPPAILRWIDRLAELCDRMAERGTAQYLFIAPEKPSVYPEMLPSWWPVAPRSAVDDVLEAISTNVRHRIVFPKTELLHEKTRRPVYGPYDTHWNGYGAYVAYKALVERVNEHHPKVGAPRPISHFKLSTLEKERVPHDLARMLGIGRLVTPDHPTFVTYPEHDPERTQLLDEGMDWWQTRVIETDAPNELTLLLIRDSFSIEMLPFLKAHFRKIVLAHSQFGFVRDDLVERFQPDIAVTEVIESRLVNMF